MPAVGSSAWISRIDGALNTREQVRFAPAAGGREVGVLAALLSRRPGRVLDADRTPPDTKPVTEIAELSATALPAALFGHSLRSWLWGSMIAEIDGIEYDEELLHVAALLHDLALSQTHRPGDGAACFAVHGASTAPELVLDAGAHVDFAEKVAGAIAAHFNVSVPLSWGARHISCTPALMSDVVGLRLGEIAASTVADMLRRVPREGFTDCFIEATRAETGTRPRSRAALIRDSVCRARSVERSFRLWARAPDEGAHDRSARRTLRRAGAVGRRRQRVVHQRAGQLRPGSAPGRLPSGSVCCSPYNAPPGAPLC